MAKRTHLAKGEIRMEEKRIDLATQLRQALEKNPHVKIAAILKSEGEYFLEIVDFYVAPKVGRYTVREMQALMTSLFPDEMSPMVKKIDFCEIDFILVLGGFFLDDTNENGKRRLVRVRLFPDIMTLAAMIINGNQPNVISKIALEKYRRMLDIVTKFLDSSPNAMII